MVPFSDSDPTELSSAPTSDAVGPYSRPIKPIQRSKLTQAPADIRSFFSSTTAGKPSGNSLHRDNSKLNRKRAIPPLTQLTLDISNRPTTQTCEACGMPYVIGVEEDQVIHAKHHRRVVGGIEWVSEETERVIWRDELKKEWIVKVPLDSKKSSKMTKKVKQILEMVNVSLSARELSAEQLNDSALYLYLGENDQSLNSKKRRRGGESYEGKKAGMVMVKAVCVAARIDKAYKMVEEHGDQNKEVIKFGEDGSAVFCSRVSQKALIGIHRIWTSPTSRGTGLAHQLMDAVTRTLIYNFPIVTTQDRRALVAFSQPTESGMKFARKWCKSTCFNLF
ncbi:hypothetical protein CROQUDRAFT_43293 [Cronartium quercuum f. sp. fusiforme G11]|uniref:N-acetyltransferase ECO1 n=1 Tax=Cronartium quercuum f. sp. fusiforme G11 TaxID=708437 RepID=A0A9P6NN15_9BASI|nr:hypothetical protein CROQUDRAFT_43293 [Cronartium quercuum f. sp. fusiforme G11]